MSSCLCTTQAVRCTRFGGTWESQLRTARLTAGHLSGGRTQKLAGFPSTGFRGQLMWWNQIESIYIYNIYIYIIYIYNIYIYIIYNVLRLTLRHIKICFRLNQVQLLRCPTGLYQLTASGLSRAVMWWTLAPLQPLPCSSTGCGRCRTTRKPSAFGRSSVAALNSFDMLKLLYNYT